MEQLTQRLTAARIPCTRQEPLCGHCTFKIGGPAAVFIRPRDEAQLTEALAACRETGVPYYLLGNGSNILFSDAGYPGAVVDLTALQPEIRREGDTLTATAGVRLSALCTAALDAGLSGLEFAYGIPGTVGGAVYMNAGAYGGEMKDVLTRVRWLNAAGQVETTPVGALEMRYAGSPSSRWISPAPAAPSSARRGPMPLCSSTSAACGATAMAERPSATSTAALWSTWAGPAVPMCWLCATRWEPS